MSFLRFVYWMLLSDAPGAIYISTFTVALGTLFCSAQGVALKIFNLPALPKSSNKLLAR